MLKKLQSIKNSLIKISLFFSSCCVCAVNVSGFVDGLDVFGVFFLLGFSFFVGIFFRRSFSLAREDQVVLCL